jgi:hypothetical protein
MHLSKALLASALALSFFGAPRTVDAQSIGIGIGISVGIAPPALPVYAQPPCPTPGYLWTPGYWSYADGGYFWVPGVWVAPPAPNLLWTPGYWAYNGGYYGWHAGYWGPHVGFYGGVNYGFGYGGVGFYGGHWGGGVFSYNTAVTNVNVNIVHNTYVDQTVVNNTYVNNHASFNGPNGVEARPLPEERAYMNEPHFNATPEQLQHQQLASSDPGQFAKNNNGLPSTTAMNTINGRRYDQQGRIANGVSSGELTPGETRNLEGRESNLNHQIYEDRQENGGSLTPEERQQVEQRQNNLSNSIYDDKHNAAVDHYGDTEVGQRRYNQQQRISNGISSGEMTPGEAARTEGREQNINRSIRSDRAANGGTLTPGERYTINQRQNSVSRQIYRQKHNDNHAPR